VLCPGSLAPVVAYDKNGIRILLHYGKDRPRPDVQVMALSTMSTNTCPIMNFSFQAAVPKVSNISCVTSSVLSAPYTCIHMAGCCYESINQSKKCSSV